MMTRSRTPAPWFVLAGLVLVGTVLLPVGLGLLVPAARAQDDAPVAKVEVKTRVQRAKDLVKRIEATRDMLVKAGLLDEKTAVEFEKALEDARRLTRPVKAEELSEDEKKGLKKEFDAEDGEGEDEGGKKWSGRVQRLLGQAFEGADLSEEQERGASKTISEWWGETMSARGERDSKKVSDLKRQRDTDLKKSLGKKKARKVINNLNSMSRGH